MEAPPRTATADRMRTKHAYNLAQTYASDGDQYDIIRLREMLDALPGGFS